MEFGLTRSAASPACSVDRVATLTIMLFSLGCQMVRVGLCESPRPTAASLRIEETSAKSSHDIFPTGQEHTRRRSKKRARRGRPNGMPTRSEQQRVASRLTQLERLPIKYHAEPLGWTCPPPLNSSNAETTPSVGSPSTDLSLRRYVGISFVPAERGIALRRLRQRE